ncbi:hypothetical protein CRYUN_Cryun11dG0081600 [Craigia yunnanensis]
MVIPQYFWQLAFAGSHGGLPDEEVYWKSVFPNTPMPKAMKDLLPPPGLLYGSIWIRDSTKESKSVDDAPDSMDQYGYGDSTKESKSVDDAPDSMDQYGYGDSTKESKSVEDAPDSMDQYGYGDSTKESKSVEDAPDSMDQYGYDDAPDSMEQYGYGDLTVFYGYGDPTKDGTPRNNYEKASGNKNSLGGNHDMNVDSNPSSKKLEVDNTAMNETIYFLQKDLHPGKKVKLTRFIKIRDMRSKTKFLPHRVGELIPFSSNKFPEILKRLSLKAYSRVANTMKGTIKGCERATINGEEKYCAATFKSFIDSSVSKLGKNTQLISSEVGKETNSPLFTIAMGVQNKGEEELVCHKKDYPYAVFLCHSIKLTTVYKVPLVGIDGKTKANGLAVCHKDTSPWNPNHAAFRSLKVRPGTVPICHFLARDTLVWVRK